MCIVYFASQTTCAHHHFLGAYNCTLNCPTSTRHTFYLRGHEYDCQTCTFLQDDQIDPDIVPVSYYAPLFDADKLAADEEEREKEDTAVAEEHASEKEDDAGAKTYKALSDPDSQTSEWRQDDDLEFEFESGKGKEWAAPGNKMHPPPPTPSTPRTKAHRHLVREQLEKLKPRGSLVHAYRGEGMPVLGRGRGGGGGGRGRIRGARRG